ncbi:MAG: VWA domain-containing protein [Treponema sp.]|nr:VWA domain-containing protein [Treponema sp.]
MIKKTFLLLLCTFFICQVHVFSQVPPAQDSAFQDSAAQDSVTLNSPAGDLVLNTDDLIIEEKYDGGFHLYIKKKPGIGSVMITETTRDPQLRSANYAYRAPQWNPINGSEIRFLDGKPISPDDKIFSLISSTPVTHPVLGEAFHIFIPWILLYGYEYTRHGEIYVSDGTYLNLRTFTLPYGDYRGPFMDNPFELQITQKKLETPAGFYMSETVNSFKKISDSGGGLLYYSAGPADLTDKIKTVLENEKGKSVDIVICLDTTESMIDDIDGIRKTLVPMLKEITQSFTDYRLGMVLYKDYFSEYLNKVIDFTKDFDLFQKNLDAIKARGGGDIPEAVYEALYEGENKFPWEAESRLLILVGDAPPHPVPRGRITDDIVTTAAAEKNIKISAIVLPQ